MTIPYPLSQEPQLEIGIVKAQRIDVAFSGDYYADGAAYNEPISFTYNDNESISIEYKGVVTSVSSIEFLSELTNNSFEIKDVTIGIDFHWQQHENQVFKGGFKILIVDESLQLINLVGLEDYVTSVISSEMNPNADFEFLKAHAIMSRSWAMAQIMNPKYDDTPIKTETEIHTWYDRQDHSLFHLCADDHCQRYQGQTRISNANALKAVEATRGQFVMHQNLICDTRFSKCCGGQSEDFNNVWQNVDVPYLQAVYDAKNEKLSDYQSDAGFGAKLNANPDVFCNTKNESILKKVLNHYDAETTDFFQWEVQYTQEELSALVLQKSGIDFGLIQELIPLQRGRSGRISHLKIIGDKKTMTIGKELEIRKYLSPTHLYSSAFVVHKTAEHFTLKGQGWGHGVGLCQIGAAVMSENGYTSEEILEHYFKHTKIKKLY